MYDETNSFGVDPLKYETHDEFREVLSKARYEYYREQTENYRRRSAEDNAHLLEDKNVYIYCAVLFEGANHAYYYRTEDESIKIGGKVIVPVGNDGKEETGLVVSVQRHLRISVPFPLERTKFIIRKSEQ